MTIIVLDTDEDTVVLAADRLWVESDHLVSYATKLVPIMSGTKTIGMIATAGDARKGIKFEEQLAAIFKRKAALAAAPLVVIRKFVDEEWGHEECPQTIVVIRGLSFVIDGDGTVTPQTRWTFGSGSHIARGAMWNRTGTAARLVKLGCKAACELMATCGGQIDVFEMPRQNS